MFLLLRLASIISCVALTVVFFLFNFKGNILLPPERQGSSGLFLLKYEFYAVIASVFVFMLYTVITQIFVYSNFAKTKTIEILFFSAFLIGCLTESARLIIPLNGSWAFTSPLVLFAGRVIVLGRMLCPLSFLFIALMSDPEQRLNEERNMTMIFFTSMVCCAIIPINSVQVTHLCTIKWGYRTFLFIFRLSVFLLSGVSILAAGIQQGSERIRQTAAGYATLVTGYFILCNTDNYLKLFAGTLLMASGTYLYLSNLHRKYLWQ
ncbi:hypothetical protein [Treponema parvum]|uniref:hypothetical protein n=1 Tax=Treponema parvum TaxID=138851 RepID=UPI001AEBBF6B|nr:hypothetical protein [Treponema parvum]QTQ15732.1 hypothetical protein HXT04_02890 [Treponema parvum]